MVCPFAAAAPAPVFQRTTYNTYDNTCFETGGGAGSLEVYFTTASFTSTTQYQLQFTMGTSALVSLMAGTNAVPPSAIPNSPVAQAYKGTAESFDFTTGLNSAISTTAQAAVTLQACVPTTVGSAATVVCSASNTLLFGACPVLPTGGQLAAATALSPSSTCYTTGRLAVALRSGPTS